MEIIGHSNTKQQIRIALESAKVRNSSLPHMLFSGAAGCGKTTMAKWLAKLAGSNFVSVSPEDMKDRDTVLDLLEKINHEGYSQKGDRVDTIKPTVVFFDEIHRMPIKGQEKLGIAMEEFQLESGSPNSYFWIPYFTVIGATTDEGMLTKPYHDRFKLKFIFQPYSMEEAFEIVLVHAKRLNFAITRRAAKEIAKRGRGVPRILVKHFENVRDMALHNGSVVITTKTTLDAFAHLNIDHNGLTPTDIKVLKALEKADCPIGLENLSIITNESQKALKNSAEPFLIQKGLMFRKGTGRVITQEGKDYLATAGHTEKKFVKEEIEADYERI